MNIDISLIESAIDNMISTTTEQMNGKCEPGLSKNEAITKLGTISALVLYLYDEVKTKNECNEVIEKVWKLKEKSDILSSKLMGIE